MTARILTRRSVLRAAAAGSALIGAPFIHRRANASETLYVNTWGGAWEESATKHLFRPFTAKTGIEIKTTSPVSYAKLAAQARTGKYDFDVTTLAGPEAVQAAPERLLEPIDGSIIDQASLPAGSIIENAVASHVFSTNIVFDRRKLPAGAVDSWKAFWDVGKNPGLRSLPRYGQRFVPIALLADGVAKSALYPPDIDRAFRSLDRIKPHVAVWWTQGSQSQQLIQDGEVSAIGIWHTVALVLIKRGVPLELVWNEAKLDRTYWGVSRGTPRAKAAWQFVNFAIQPQALGGFCTDTSYGPAYPKAFEHIPQESAGMMPTYPDNIKLCFEEDSVSIGTALTGIMRRFNTWVQS
ncbi:MAG: ABC transporter substrate-binding protein [Alphaproteobacteria bacterium]